MATVAVSPDQDAISAEIEIAAAPDRVFAALTDVKQLSLWWISPTCSERFWQMDARDGGEWSFGTSSGSKSVNGINDFECHGKILEYKPPRLLVYTWIANWSDKPESVTVVKWELSPSKTGTRLKVTHSGLAQQKIAREDYRGGWPGVLGNLKQFVENQ